MENKQDDSQDREFLLCQLERLNILLEKMKLAEYVQLLERPGRLLWLNFAGGIARGLGIALGATLIFALVLNILKALVVTNMLGIGHFVADIMSIVELQQGKF